MRLNNGNGLLGTRWAIATMALVLLAYTVVRASTVSLSYDEGWTFLNHVRKAIFYQQDYDQMGGNHHLLNVWGMWASMKLFGTSEMALRLPNLLAHVLYLYASARIALKARTALLAITAFVLLNAHPYVLDFFSLARGYGLAFGWLMMSLWQAWRFFEEGQPLRRLATATVCAALAAMSHVIMINYLIAFGLAFVALGVWCARTTGWRPLLKHLLVLVAIGTTGLAAILPNALGLFHGGSLNFGCGELWNCMVRSVSEKILYHTDYGEAPSVIMGRVLGALAAWFALSFFVAWRMASTKQRPFVFALVVLCACVLSFLLQNALFGVPLPETRTALFLLPLCAFVFVSSVIAWSGPLWAASLASVAMCVPVVVNLVRGVNNDHSVEWVTTGEVRRAFEVLAADHLPLSAERPQVNIATGMECSGLMGYYIMRRDWQWMAGTERQAQDSFPRSDYYLVEWNAHQWLDQRHCTKLFHSASTGLALFRDERMRAAGRTTLHHERFIQAEHPAESLTLLTWCVPPEEAGSTLIITGSVRAKELSDENWLGLTLQVRREGRVIEEGGQPSHRQVLRYGEWGTASAELMPRTKLLAGDTIQFMVGPCFKEPAIEIGDADLWILE